MVEHLAELSIPGLAVLYSDSDAAGRQKIDEYMGNWRHFEPGINGHTLATLGVPPGPTYRFILGELRKAWLDGEVSNPEQEKEMLSQLLTKAGEIQSDI
jgi:hypothetical protein